MKQEIIRIELENVNCYLIKVDSGFILIDTGGHTVMDREFSNKRQKLDEELKKAGCVPGNLKLVVLTHGDYDHTTNAAYIRREYRTKIAMHSGDLKLVQNPTIDKVMENSKYKSLPLRIVFLLLKSLFIKLSRKVIDTYEKFTPDILLEEGCDLMEYGLNASIIHIPGHTAGSIGILTNEGELIVGDTLSNIKRPQAAANASDFKLLKMSINRLKMLNLKTIFPGHGKPFSPSELQ